MGDFSLVDFMLGGFFCWGIFRYGGFSVKVDFTLGDFPTNP